MATAGEKTLAIEWLVVMLIETGDNIAKARATGKASRWPSPQRYFATMVVYLMLAGAAAFGQGAAKVAASLK